VTSVRRVKDEEMASCSSRGSEPGA
jgi:hypothetical protein